MDDPKLASKIISFMSLELAFADLS
jgi:hypothetical protein